MEGPASGAEKDQLIAHFTSIIPITIPIANLGNTTRVFVKCFALVATLKNMEKLSRNLDGHLFTQIGMKAAPPGKPCVQNVINP